MNKFEELQSTIITGTQFIKSYPMLNLINITPSEKSFIELVLSYQNNGQEFFMEFSEIANILGVKKQSVSNLVKSLKSLEYINAKNSSRYKGKFIGSTTFITVNEDKIIASVQAALSNKPNLEAEIVKEAKKKAPKSITPKVEVVVPEPIKEVATIKQLTIEDELEDRGLPLTIQPKVEVAIEESPLKAKMRENFESKFRYPIKSEKRIMNGGEFHSLTNNKFQGKLDLRRTMDVVKTLNNKDFELFWNTIQELKQECITNQPITA